MRWEQPRECLHSEVVANGPLTHLLCRAKEPRHTFSIHQLCNEWLLPTSCASRMSRAEEETSHGAGLRSPATNGHHISGGSPTARRTDTSDPANSLPLTKGLMKGTPCICSSLYRYAVQARVAPHKDHISCTIDEKLLLSGK